MATPLSDIDIPTWTYKPIKRNASGQGSAAYINTGTGYDGPVFQIGDEKTRLNLRFKREPDGNRQVLDIAINQSSPEHKAIAAALAEIDARNVEEFTKYTTADLVDVTYKGFRNRPQSEADVRQLYRSLLKENPGYDPLLRVKVLLQPTGSQEKTKIFVVSRELNKATGQFEEVCDIVDDLSSVPEGSACVVSVQATNLWIANQMLGMTLVAKQLLVWPRQTSQLDFNLSADNAEQKVDSSHALSLARSGTVAPLLTEVDYSNFYYKPPKKNKGAQGLSIYMGASPSDNTAPQFQLGTCDNRMRIRFVREAQDPTSRRRNIEIAVNRSTQANVVTTLRQLDQQNMNKISDLSNVSVEMKPMDVNTVRTCYRDMLQQQDEKYDPLLRVKVTVGGNSLTEINVVGEDGSIRSGTMDDISENSDCLAIVEFNNIWRINGNMGTVVLAKRLLVWPSGGQRQDSSINVTGVRMRSSSAAGTSASASATGTALGKRSAEEDPSDVGAKRARGDDDGIY